MESATDPLVNLRDIMLPMDPAMWPPSPGWWIIFLVVVAVLVFLARTWIQHRTKKRPLKELVKQLTALELAGDPQQQHHMLQQMSVLLRQFAIARFGRNQVAHLHGDSWLLFLDNSSRSGSPFSAGPGRMLMDAPYMPAAAVDLEALRETLVSWARQCPPPEQE